MRSTRPTRHVPRFLRVLVPPVVALVALGAYMASSSEPTPATTPAAPAAPVLRATPDTLDAVYAGAVGGETIRLAAGDYGAFAGGVKPETVTLEPDPGAEARIGITLERAAHLRVQGLVVTSALIVNSHDVAFLHNRFVGPALIETTRDIDHRIRFDGNTHRDIDVCGKCFAGRITVRGHGNTAPNGVKIVNSEFSGGNADGVHVTGNAYGTQIGPGNRFVDMPMVDDTHIDAIQLYGSRHTRIVGNFIHGAATGIMAGDGARHELIEDNVIVTLGYPWGIVLGGDRGSTVRHNTLPDGPCEWELRCGLIRVDSGSDEEPSTGTVVTRNITGGLVVGDGSELALEDENLIGLGGGGQGPNDLSGGPVFEGGVWPASWAGFELAPGSPAKGGAGEPDLGARVPRDAPPS
jgi:hypothetical protein